MVEARQTRVWISDGSGAPFADLEVLPVAHVGAMGHPLPYKGTIDTKVLVGEAAFVTSREDDCFVPEAEWCLTFQVR